MLGRIQPAQIIWGLFKENLLQVKHVNFFSTTWPFFSVIFK